MLLLSFVAVVSTEARTVTIFRVQLGAYETQAEADAKKASAEAEGFDPVYVVQKAAPFPWKVMTGDWVDHLEAKTQCTAWRKAGKNEGKGFVTGVDFTLQDAVEMSLPVPETALDTAQDQLVFQLSTEGEVARSQAQFRVQIGSSMTVVEAEKLRGWLWFKGESPLYIKCYGSTCAVLAGDHATGESAVLEASRLLSIEGIASTSVVQVDPEESLLDVTTPRSEEELLQAVMALHPQKQQFQWANVDAGLQYLRQYPDGSHRAEVQQMLGIRLYELFWQQRRGTEKRQENLALLRSDRDEAGGGPEGETSGMHLARLGLAPSDNVKGTEYDRERQPRCFQFILFNVFVRKKGEDISYSFNVADAEDWISSIKGLCPQIDVHAKSFKKP